jgi:hypothetical protein
MLSSSRYTARQNSGIKFEFARQDLTSAFLRRQCKLSQQNGLLDLTPAGAESLFLGSSPPTLRWSALMISWFIARTPSLLHMNRKADQVRHAKLTHVAQCHRRRLRRFHC